MSPGERTEDVDTGDVVLSCAVFGEGPLVLALHGFPDCRETFLPVVPALVQAGFRVVLPTLRGYRPSGVARSGRHDALAAAEDLAHLAERFAPGEPVRLVGHDWGAVASFAAAALGPGRFSHLVSMSVPHPAAFLRCLVRPAQLRRSWYMGLFQLPGIAESRLARGDLALVDRLWRDWSPGYAASDAEMRQVKDGIRDRIGPALDYYRALRSPRAMLARATYARMAVPAIHLHGDDDGCIGVECCAGAERHYERGYALYRIAGAGHFLTREQPDEVARILVGFLRS